MWNAVTPAQPCRCRRRSMRAVARSPLAPSRCAGVAGDAEPQPPADHRRGGQPNRQRQPVQVARLHQECGGTPAAVMAAARQPAVRAQPASRIG